VAVFTANHLTVTDKPSKKAHGSVVSNRIGMKCDRNVQANTYRLTESK